MKTDLSVNAERGTLNISTKLGSAVPRKIFLMYQIPLKHEH